MKRTKPAGPARIQAMRIRRSIGQARAGRALKRLLGREVRIPRRTEPDPDALVEYPGEAQLPEAIRDGRILADALAWRRSKVGIDGAEHSHRPMKRMAAAAQTPPIRNIVFASHCDFTGNSGLHVYAIAEELERRGYSVVVAVPDHAESLADAGPASFRALTYAEIVVDPLRFPDGRGPDLVHAFTPRELVRNVTVEIVRRHACRYLVHLEDNDGVVLSGELGGADPGALSALPLPQLDRMIRPRQAHPLRAARFLELAAGVTVLNDRLLELVPEGVPAAVIRAGFDEAVLTPRRSRDDVRAELQLESGDIAVLYMGTIHALNRDEVSCLYDAVARLREDGTRAVLVKTGTGSDVAATFRQLGGGVRDLGWVPRRSIPDILAAADILVQPGAPSPFNDFRVPSKLAEYLASGRPVVLPRTNLGLELRDGEEALLLYRGDAQEIATAIERLAADPDLRTRLGEAGRAFALRELGWPASVDTLELLLGEIAANGRPAASPRALNGADPPAKLVALVPELPDEEAALQARAHGIFGFAIDAATPFDLAGSLPIEFPFCLRLRDTDTRTLLAAVEAFTHAGYIQLGGTPLVLCGEEVLGEGLRASIEGEAGRPVRLAVLGGSPGERREGRVFDSSVEEGPRVEADYERSMLRSLSVSLPESPWFRNVPLPNAAADLPLYSTWLRKLVLQTALRAPCQTPLVFVDAMRVWTKDTHHEDWLRATRTGLKEGIRQYYASQHLALDNEELDAIIRAL